MSRRIVRLELDVLVVRGTLSFFDDAGDQVAPDLDPPDEWLFTADNAVVVTSAGHTDHYAAVAMEVWDGEPPAEEGWEASGERTVRLDSGDLEVYPFVAPPGTQVLRVGPRGRYRVRGHATGRAELADLTPDPDINALRGVERFLLRFWPG